MRGGGEYLSFCSHCEGVSPYPQSILPRIAQLFANDASTECSLYLNRKAGLLRYKPRNDRYAFTLPEGATHVALLDNFRKAAFTLAEVLITLGVIGIVAAITLPSVITKLNNRGYVEQFKKDYSVIQQATGAVAQELGEEPAYWNYSEYVDSYELLNEKIWNLYKKNMKLAKSECEFAYEEDVDSKCVLSNYKYKSLNGETQLKPFYSSIMLYHTSMIAMLADGSSVAAVFQKVGSGSVFWPLVNEKIKILFIVDVNGKKKPNTLGRDIFFVVLYNDGKILPYGTEDTSDCTPEDAGNSCAARIINEGKMNY